MLELGGSDPFIVLKDADLNKAVEIGVISRCMNSGQTCCSAKRFFVHQDVYNEFSEQFVEAMRAQKVGDPANEETDIGPLARADIQAGLKEQVERSLNNGSKLLCGAETPFKKGFYYTPTVLEGGESESPALKEELFGPVAVLLPFKSNEELIKLANASQYGLAATVMSENIEAAEQLAKELEVGTVTINGVVGSDARLPFGGVKASGIGRELSKFGMWEFANIKTVWIK